MTNSSEDDAARFQNLHFLYRFRSAKTNYFKEELEQAIKNRAIYLSSIETQNDPFDSRPVFQESTLKEVNKALKKQYGNRPVVEESNIMRRFLNKEDRRRALKNLRPGVATAQLLQKAIQDHVRGFRRRAKIGCLSERWDSILMWSHYTNSHSGYCIEYKVSKDLKTPSIGKIPMPVVYSTTRSNLVTMDLMEMINEVKSAESSSINLPYKIIQALLLEKSVDWAYEKEWRVHSMDEKLPGYRKFSWLTATRVILGSNISEKNILSIRSALQQALPLAKAALHATEYKLVLEEV